MAKPDTIRSIASVLSLSPNEGRGSQEINNAMLNLGYAVLSSYILNAIINAGLEPYLGIMHGQRPGKMALVLDMMEEYRAWVVDRAVIKLRAQSEGKKFLDTTHNLTMRNDKLGLHGIVDMAVETDESVYAVEFKLSANNKKRGDILQLVAYAILLEQHFSKSSRIGFLVGKGKVLHSIDINSERRQAVITMADQIRQMLQRGLKPESSATIVQCCACEYVNHCNDRL